MSRIELAAAGSDALEHPSVTHDTCLERESLVVVRTRAGRWIALCPQCGKVQRDFALSD